MEASFAQTFSWREKDGERHSEVNADKLGNGASAVFVVRPGNISTDKGENWNSVRL